jgi:hypothetical protein
VGNTGGLNKLKLVASGVKVGPVFISKTLFEMACDTRFYLHSLTLSPTDASQLWQMFAGKAMNPAMAATYGWRAFTQSMLVMALDQSASNPGASPVINQRNFPGALAALEQFHQHHPWPWYRHLVCYPKYHVVNSASGFVDSSAITLLRGAIARYFSECDSGVDLTQALLDRYAPHSTSLLPGHINFDGMAGRR